MARSTSRTFNELLKKRKCDHISTSEFPPAFWDNLSRIHLTSRALAENNRRQYDTREVRVTPSSKLIPATDFLLDCGENIRQDIRQLSRHGGPDLSTLRQFPLVLANAMSSRSNSRPPKRSKTSITETYSNTTSSRTTGPYNRNFRQNLIDGAVFPFAYDYPDGQPVEEPDNWSEIRKRLGQPRRSLSPSIFPKEEYKKFIRAARDTDKEKKVITSVLPIIEGDVGDAKYVAGGIPFNNLDHLTDGTLPPGNPDIYNGARPEQLDRQIRDRLYSLIVPSTQDDLPICPNFFVATKEPDGSFAVATRQATYNGALGARAMDSLKALHENCMLRDHNAYTITSVYYDGALDMYTSHRLPSSQRCRQPAYATHLLGSWAMEGNFAAFRHGATAYRNGREWAKQQRDEVIEQANKKIRNSQLRPLALELSFASIDSESTVGHSFLERRTSSTEVLTNTNHQP